jgi:hypothetical protein
MFNQKSGSTIDRWRSQHKGRIIMAHPLHIHSFHIASIIIAEAELN